MLDESRLIAQFVTDHSYALLVFVIACGLLFLFAFVAWGACAISSQISQRDERAQLALTRERRRMIIDHEARRKDW